MKTHLNLKALILLICCASWYLLCSCTSSKDSPTDQLQPADTEQAESVDQEESIDQEEFIDQEELPEAEDSPTADQIDEPQEQSAQMQPLVAKTSQQQNFLKCLNLASLGKKTHFCGKKGLINEINLVIFKLLKANRYLALRQLEPANKLAGQLIARYPFLAAPYIIKANILTIIGKSKAAIGLYKKALSLTPDNPELKALMKSLQNKPEM